MLDVNPEWDRLEKWELINLLKVKTRTIRHQSQEIGKLHARVKTRDEMLKAREHSNA